MIFWILVLAFHLKNEKYVKEKSVCLFDETNVVCDRKASLWWVNGRHNTIIEAIFDAPFTYCHTVI